VAYRILRLLTLRLHRLHAAPSQWLISRGNRIGSLTLHPANTQHNNMLPASSRLSPHIGDVAFWEDTHTLPHTLPLDILRRRCTAATLRISNQKNGRRNSTIHHESTNTATCPIAALARRVNHIIRHTTDPQTMLGTFFTSIHRPGRQITSHDISSTIKNTTKTLGSRGSTSIRKTSRAILSELVVANNKRDLFIGCINEEHAAHRQRTRLAHE
jgi:hypothetical protein